MKTEVQNIYDLIREERNKLRDEYNKEINWTKAKNLNLQIIGIDKSLSIFENNAKVNVPFIKYENK